jgi:hypothetical protein
MTNALATVDEVAPPISVKSAPEAGARSLRTIACRYRSFEQKRRRKDGPADCSWSAALLGEYDCRTIKVKKRGKPADAVKI